MENNGNLNPRILHHPLINFRRNRVLINWLVFFCLSTNCVSTLLIYKFARDFLLCGIKNKQDTNELRHRMLNVFFIRQK